MRFLAHLYLLIVYKLRVLSMVDDAADDITH